MAAVRGNQHAQANAFVHPRVERKAAPQVLRKDQATAWLAPRHRLALPEVRARYPQADSRRQAAAGNPANAKVGEIKATIVEKDGKIMMIKDCPKHGHFEDVMSVDPAFSKHLEDVFPGRDIRAHADEKLHNHGTSTVKHGRGSVLTVDLTNRCNMMCDPCFMDANQVGFVHELTWDEIKQLLDNAVTIKPKRQMSVQFSGGEPTLTRTSWTPFATHAMSAIRRCRPQPTASSSPSPSSSASRLRKPDCVTFISSSTESATLPTPIARSATCST